MNFSDSALVQGILAKDRKAFEIMYETYFPKVYNYVLVHLREKTRTEQVTEEILTEVIHTIEQYSATSSLSEWIFKIVRKHCALGQGQPCAQLRPEKEEYPEAQGSFFRLEETLLKYHHVQTV